MYAYTFTHRCTSMNKLCWQSGRIIMLWIWKFSYLKRANGVLDEWLSSLLATIFYRNLMRHRGAKTDLQKKKTQEKFDWVTSLFWPPFLLVTLFATFSLNPPTLFLSDVFFEWPNLIFPTFKIACFYSHYYICF